MQVPSNLVEFWARYTKGAGTSHENRFYEAFYFGDGEAMANELGALVLSGIKCATAGSLWSYEKEAMPLPLVGNLSIVTDWSGRPLCIIETQTVEVVAFNEVTADFAAAEGEGDGSLSYWQREHREFFTRDCARMGIEFHESMPVVCERFGVVYRTAPSAL